MATKSHKSKGPYPHLLPSVLPAFSKPDKEREMLMFEEKFIPYSMAVSILEEMEDMMLMPKKARTTNLLVISPSDNGKSVIANTFAAKYPRIVNTTGGADSVPVVMCDAPPEAIERRIYSQILNALKLEHPSGGRSEALFKQVVKSLDTLGTQMLIIDEIQGVFEGYENFRRVCLNALKILSNAIRIPIVCFGVEEAQAIMSTDASIASRFPPIMLPKWDDETEYASLLMSYETIMPLKLPSNLTEPDLAEAIRTKGKRVLGGIDMILAKATRLAIREGTEKVTLDLVNRVNYGGPKVKTRADLA